MFSAMNNIIKELVYYLLDICYMVYMYTCIYGEFAVYILHAYIE